MEKYTCCQREDGIDCTIEATWIIEFSNDPMDFTCACDTHIGDLIDDRVGEVRLRRILNNIPFYV